MKKQKVRYGSEDFLPKTTENYVNMVKFKRFK